MMIPFDIGVLNLLVGVAIGLRLGVLSERRNAMRNSVRVPTPTSRCLNPDYCGLGDADTLCDVCKCGCEPGDYVVCPGPCINAENPR